MKCPYCEKRIAKDAKRCKYCGKRIKTDGDKQQSPVLAIILIAAALLAILVAVLHNSARNAKRSGDVTDVTVGSPAPYYTQSAENDKTPSPDETSEPAGDVNVSEDTTPEPTAEVNVTPQEYKFSITELNKGVWTDAYGHLYSYKDSSFCVDDTEKKTDEIISAYVVTFTSGKVGIVATQVGFEQEYVATYISDDGEISAADTYSNTIIKSIDGDKIVITEQLDCFGTWLGAASCSISDDMKLSLSDDKYKIEDDFYKSIEITALCDVSAKDENGKDIVISAGTKLTMAYIGTGKTRSAYFSAGGKIVIVDYIVTDRGNMVNTPDGQKNEYEVFDNMPYSG